MDVESIWIIGREGCWIDHNRMRGPILVESSGYPLGFPRSDFSKLSVAHDGGKYFVVYLEGKPDFIQSFRDAEIWSGELKEVLQAVFDRASFEDDSFRTELAKYIYQELYKYIIDTAEIMDEDIEFLKDYVFNWQFPLVRLSKQEISDRNLLP